MKPQQIKPFIINSTLVADAGDFSSYQRCLHATSTNTGNSYITYCLCKELFGTMRGIPQIQNIFHYLADENYDTARDIEYINSNCTHVFLMLQDFIRAGESQINWVRWKPLCDFISQIKLPIIVAGLGANYFEYDSEFSKKLCPDMKRFLKILGEKCAVIGVRGNFTAQVLHELGINNVRVIGCPTFFEMGDQRNVAKAPITDVRRDILLSQASPITALANNYQVCQDFQEENILKAIAFDDFDTYLTPHEIDGILNQRYRFFTSINDWRDFVRGFKFVIGNRVHGSVISVNAGVPALCSNRDGRAAEMCDLLKIPVYTDINADTDPVRLYDELVDVDAMNKAYEKLYAVYREFLAENGLSLYAGDADDMDLLSIQLYRGMGGRAMAVVYGKPHAGSDAYKNHVYRTAPDGNAG